MSRLMVETFFNQPITDDIKTYENRKNTPGQGDDYATGCLLDILKKIIS